MTAARFVVRGSRKEAAIVAVLAAFAIALRFDHLNRDLDIGKLDGWSLAPDLFHFTVFGSALLTALFILVRRPSVVEVGPEGILIPAHSRIVIPWLAIEAAWPEGEDKLYLSLRNPERYPAQGWLARLRGWWRPREADVVIRLTHARSQLDDLLAAVDARRSGLIRGL